MSDLKPLSPEDITALMRAVYDLRHYVHDLHKLVPKGKYEKQYGSPLNQMPGYVLAEGAWKNIVEPYINEVIRRRSGPLF